MRRALPLLALFTVACGAGQPSADAGASDAGAGLSAFQQAVLDAHNGVRARAMPAPLPALPALSWSAAAQQEAEAWAARCDFQHNPTQAFGENLYASTRDDPPAQVVQSWASEAADYDAATNRCATGRACGHYTQLVWRATTSVGCARQQCQTGSPLGAGTWFFWVCDYAPPGNVVGQRPY